MATIIKSEHCPSVWLQINKYKCNISFYTIHIKFTINKYSTQNFLILKLEKALVPKNKCDMIANKAIHVPNKSYVIIAHEQKWHQIPF